MSELARVELLRAIYGGSAGGPSDAVAVGIGDDAAVIAAPAGEQLVWTVDDQVEGTHFDRRWLSLEDVGWRATMAAASDIAAMGARPLALLSSLVLPAALADVDLEAVARGVRAAADTLAVRVAGGNLARGPTLVLSTTVLGATRAPVLRSGARPGDGLWLAGAVGIAAAGLRLLSDPGAPAVARVGPGDTVPARGVATAAAAAWRCPVARIAEGIAMAAAGATAAIDVSDGLARDAGHIARASGVALVLDADAVVSRVLVAIARDGDDQLALALGGGEDYALLATSPSPLPGFLRIGDVRVGEGVFLRRAGTETPVDVPGYDHFPSP